jgi:hypothetical protein
LLLLEIQHRFEMQHEDCEAHGMRLQHMTMSV